MKCNVGGIDRKLRVLVGILILAAGAYFQNWLGVIGFIPLLTGLIGWCPAYMPFGLSTSKSCQCAKKSSPEEAE